MKWTVVLTFELFAPKHTYLCIIKYNAVFGLRGKGNLKLDCRAKSVAIVKIIVFTSSSVFIMEDSKIFLAFVSGTLCLAFLAFEVAGYRLDDFVLTSHLSYLEQRPRSYTPESWERGTNIVVGIYMVILYMMFRLREHMRLQNVKDIRRQLEFEDLFRMETEFIDKLRSQGIELDGPTLDSTCA
nr:uncharacterized protein LOC108019694 [Drosophila suzukii]